MWRRRSCYGSWTINGNRANVCMNLIVCTFISALGAMLIGSRLKKHETVEDTTKFMIIKKIDDIENMEKNEVEVIISMVKDLHDEVKSGRKKC